MNSDDKTVLNRLCDLKDQLLISNISFFCETRIVVISLARSITLKLLLVDQIRIPSDHQTHNQNYTFRNHRKYVHKGIFRATYGVQVSLSMTETVGSLQCLVILERTSNACLVMSVVYP
jgi:hypothetical protein